MSDLAPTAGGRRAVLVPVLVLLALCAVPRAFRLDSIGEGTDEAYSVMATRAMVEGRFSYADLNDFTADGYQAKFTPVAEAVAAPFVRVLGDRPLAYRLPSLLASLATIALVAFALARRHGKAAVLVTGLLVLLDYRSLVYAETHRYVAVEQLLLVGAFLLALRAEATRRAGPAVLAAVLGLLAFHAHFLALLVLAPLGAWILLRALRRRGGVRRPAPHVLPLVLLAVEAAVVLVLFRSHASKGLFEETGLLEGGQRAFLSTARMVGGLGPFAAALGLIEALRGVRSPRLRARALSVVLLGGTILFALLALRYDLRPRYGICLAPFLWLAAGESILRWRARTAAGPAIRVAALGTVALASWSIGAFYLATGGGRDAEDRAIEVLSRDAKPGEGVLYDAGFQDPFGRRPPEFPAFPPSRLVEPDALAALDAANVRWVWTSTGEPPRALYGTSAWHRRLGEAVFMTYAPGLLAEGRTLTLRRLRPRDAPR